MSARIDEQRIRATGCLMAGGIVTAVGILPILLAPAWGGRLALSLVLIGIGVATVVVGADQIAIVAQRSSAWQSATRTPGNPVQWAVAPAPRARHHVDLLPFGELPPARPRR